MGTETLLAVECFVHGVSAWHAIIQHNDAGYGVPGVSPIGLDDTFGY